MQVGGWGKVREVMCYSHKRCREMQARNSEWERGGSQRVGGVTVWRGRACWGDRVEMHTRVRTHTHSQPLCHILYMHTHRGWILFERAVLELYSCPYAFFTFAVDGWRTEPNVSTWAPPLWRAAQNWLAGWKNRTEREKKRIDFTVFKDALQCYSLMRAN